MERAYLVEAVAVDAEVLVVVGEPLGGAEVTAENVGARLYDQGLKVDLGLFNAAEGLSDVAH